MMRRHRQMVMLAWLPSAALIPLAWIIYQDISGLSSPVELPSAGAAVPEQQAPASSSPILVGPSKESLAVILERPVFSKSRRPTEGTGAAPVTPVDVRLVGVVISASERSALIQEGNGASVQRVKEG